MSLFRKKTQKSAQAVVTAPQPIRMNSNRLGPVFQQMYLWILSVNLNRNVYQLECGTAQFAGQPIPPRGRWMNLVEQLVEAAYPECQERVKETFSIKHLTAAFSSGKKRVYTLFDYDEGDETGKRCVHICLERIPQKNSRSFSAIVYARVIQNEDDLGNTYQPPQPVKRTADNQIDWDSVWTRRIFGNSFPKYEYDIQNDTFYLHTGHPSSRRNRVWTRFLGSLDSRSDVFLSHDSISTLRGLLQKGMDGDEGAAVIGVRMGVNQNAPIEHYEITCYLLEDGGNSEWLFGSMRNVEEQYKRQKQMQDIVLEMGTAFEHTFEGLYVINTEKNTIRSLVRTEGGYISDSYVQNYTVYLNQRIKNGVVAEESIPNVQKLLQKGYLDRMAAHQTYEMDFRLKLPGKLDYKWYMDTFAPIQNKPHQYLLTRRDVTSIYAAKERDYAYAESQRMAQYNQAMLDTLAGLVEFRNVESGAHVAHVRVISRILMEDIARRSPQYGMTQRMIDLYTHASVMHDVGKLSVPDAILNKPDRLTPEEYAQMKLHTVIGAQIIRNLQMPGQDELKECCYQVALHHHERWDGSGFPDNLAGEQINIYVQAISLADVCDALVSDRCYKAALSFEEAGRMISNGECGAFNPRVIDSFTHCLDAIRKAYETEEPQQQKDEVTNGE